MKLAKWCGAMAAACCVMSLAPTAGAEPATAGVLQLGLGFRYGADTDDLNVNPWGMGLGLSAGYTMRNAVYLGGNFEYFFGETVTGPGSEFSANLWQLSAEGGYDVGLGDSFVIRPKLGVGMASIMAEACVAGVCADDSESDFLLAPGATFILLTRSFSLSLDLRYAMVFAEPETANALIFSAGIGF